MFAKVEITGKIYVKTGLHIGGNSNIAAIGAVDSPVIRDTLTQKPMLPGSSLKGKMRTLLAKQYNNGVKKCDDDDERITRLFGTSKKDENGKVRSGRLLFCDMVIENQKELEDIAASDTEIKFENTIHRFTASATPRQIERVIAGAVFPLQMIYNMDNEKEMESDFKTLKDGFQMLQYDYLGGSGSRGYGRIRIQDLNVQVRIGEVNNEVLKHCENLLKEV